MNISRFDAAAVAFLRHAGAFLRADAIGNNVMLGIAERLVDAPQDDAVMLTVDDGGCAPHLAGLMTPPWRLIVSTGAAEAVPALVDAALECSPRPPGVLGNTAMAEGFAAAWQAATGETPSPAHEMTLYVADRAAASGDVPGRLRAAEAGESEWVAECFVKFNIAIGAGDAVRDESRTSAAASMRRGDVWVWEVGASPVSMACCSRMASDGARVGPVYTPPAMRGRGYASVAVAALTARLLGDGARWCVIFADMANAATNRMYRRIGYKEYATFREYDFAS